MRGVHIELLLNRRVYDRTGTRSIGRLEEMVAETRAHKTCVVEYHVGVYAMLERLAAWHIGRAVLAAIGQRGGYRVRWDQLDLSDCAKPRITCNISDLRRL
ncbi:MAG TPA: hypothetical protein VNT02_00285 [Burkholderiales bacterium]|nr:hypothetical protein [Burkholderiales bacterium]